jgi:hypothetical protein
MLHAEKRGDMNVIIEKRCKMDPDFDTIQWVLKARSKDDMRKNITGVNVSSGVFCCTDGHRLHAAAIETFDVPDGSYFVKSSNKSIIVLELNDYDFPQYERVFPVFNPKHFGTYSGNGDGYGRSKFVKDVYRNFTSDSIGMNLDYLLDAFIPDVEIEIAGEGRKGKPVVFWAPEPCKAAIVMPLNM